ncbi:MAG: hypothetical protein ACPG6P_13215 [Akkermansiaceae bacterium]
MSEEEEKHPMAVTPKSIGCMAAMLIVGLLFLAMIGFPFFGEVLVRLVSGWFFFLIANAVSISWNVEMILCGVGALLIAVFGLHRLILWLRKSQRWTWAWTWSITALMLMLFAASIAMTGIIHQVGWMAREPLTHDRGRAILTTNVSNAKQMFYVMIDYDQEEGRLPDSMRQLMSSELISEGGYDILQFRPGGGAPREPWIYLGAGKSYNDIAGDEVRELLLLSPSPIKGRWIGLYFDGSVSTLSEKKIRTNHPEVLQRYPNLF